MMSEHILFTREAGVLTIALNRPDKKNAIDRAMYGAMAEALRAANNDGDIRAVLFKGVPGAFSAGNDIKDFVAFAAKGERMNEVEDFLFSVVRARKPLLAAVDGLAIGIGTTLLFHCDLVYASTRSHFRTPFLDLGLVPEAASSLIAPRVMGHQRAFALLVAGEAFDAETARQAGFVTKVVDEADVERYALEAAQRLAAKPPEALAIGRDLLRGNAEEIEARIRLEIDHFAARLQSREARDAFTAFMTRSG